MGGCEIARVPTVAPGRPRRSLRAACAVARWAGWWLASGMVVTGSLAASLMIGHRNLTLKDSEICLALAIPGFLLGAILWRRRRDTDGALGSMILTAGFWIALWVIVWRLAQTT